MRNLLTAIEGIWMPRPPSVGWRNRATRYAGLSRARVPNREGKFTMHVQALYVVDFPGRYRYIWAGSAAEAREKAAAPALPMPAGAPHQHPKVLVSPRGMGESSPGRTIGTRTVTEDGTFVEPRMPRHQENALRAPLRCISQLGVTARPGGSRSVSSFIAVYSCQRRRRR
jgi:hypothetical protein